MVAVGVSWPPYLRLDEGGGDVIFVLAVGVLPADEISSSLFLLFIGAGTDFREQFGIFGVGGEVAEVGGLVGGGGFGVLVYRGGPIVVVIVMRDDIVFVDGGSNFILSVGAPAIGKAAVVEKTHGTESIKLCLIIIVIITVVVKHININWSVIHELTYRYLPRLAHLKNF